MSSVCTLRSKGQVILQDNHRRLQQLLLGRGRLQRVVFHCVTLCAKLHRAQHNRWQVGARCPAMMLLAQAPPGAHTADLLQTFVQRSL